jgi:HD-like signal output (HDOD) protein
LWASSAAFQVRSEEYREEDLQSLADHSRAVAESAREIMKTLTADPVAIGDAHLAGLLHEVGTLALGGNGRLRPPGSGSTTNRPQTADSPNTEGRAAGAGPDAGGYLAALWGLPDPVVQAIAYHRVPDRCPKEPMTPLLAVHVAHALLDQSPGEQDGTASPLDVDYLQKAGCRDRLRGWRTICEAYRAEGVLP